MTETLEQVLAWVTIGLAIGTALSPALTKVADLLVKAAAETPSRRDDKVAAGFQRFSLGLAKALDVAGRAIPVVTSGGRARK